MDSQSHKSKGFISPGITELSDSDELIRSGLKLNHMKMIVALDDSGQISAAAAAMQMSQPAASRMLSEMENILGVELCRRFPRGIALTPYGKAFARRARTILLELREVDREISDLHSGKGGSVYFGSVTAPAVNLVVPAIAKVRELYPRININIQVETSTFLARELLASRLDFMIARIPDDLNPRLFESRVIGIERACLMVRKGHPLLSKPMVSLEDTNNYDWVFQPEGSLLRRTMEGIFMSKGIPLPERIVNTTSIFLTTVMVAQTNAVTAIAVEVADFLVGTQGLAGSLAIIPIDFDISVQPYSLITAKNRQLSPAAQLIYNMVLEEIR